MSESGVPVFTRLPFAFAKRNGVVLMQTEDQLVVHCRPTVSPHALHEDRKSVV